MKAVVLTFDCLPTTSLCCYGHAECRTPNFDRLAAQSIVFDEHFAENLDPDAANHAFWTGCYQFPRSHNLQRSLPSWEAALQQSGVEISTLLEAPQSGARIVQPNFREAIPIASHDTNNSTPEESPFAKLVAQAIDLVKSHSHSPNSSLILLKSHGLPENPVLPEEFAELSHEIAAATAIDQNQADEFSTDGSQDPNAPDSIDSWVRDTAYVALIDRYLGELWETLQEQFADEPFLFLVTAAEGTRWKDFESAATDVRLCESLAHVPLFVHVGGAEMGSRRRCLTQTVDVASTLVDWFDAGPMACEGKSLLPAVRDMPCEEREAVYLGIGLRAVGIRSQDYLLVQSGDETSKNAIYPWPATSSALYVKPDDRWDVHDVGSQAPAVVDTLQEDLARFIGEHQNAVDNSR